MYFVDISKLYIYWNCHAVTYNHIRSAVTVLLSNTLQGCRKVEMEGCIASAFHLTSHHEICEHAIPYLVLIDTTRMRLSKRRVV
jgi:hypothetical protein